MKKLIALFTLFCLPFLGLGQDLKLNPDTKLYEAVVIVPQAITAEQIEQRIRQLNYKEIQAEPALVSGEGITGHLVGGHASVEIQYTARVEIKDNRYRIVLTGFKLTDRNGAMPLENMGAFVNRWVKIINKKTPGIITAIQTESTADNW